MTMKTSLKGINNCKPYYKPQQNLNKFQRENVKNKWIHENALSGKNPDLIDQKNRIGNHYNMDVNTLKQTPVIQGQEKYLPNKNSYLTTQQGHLSQDIIDKIKNKPLKSSYQAQNKISTIDSKTPLTFDL